MQGSKRAVPPPRSPKSSPLTNLWELIPESNRNRVLDDLSRLIEKQLTTPKPKEVSNERH